MRIKSVAGVAVVTSVLFLSGCSQVTSMLPWIKNDPTPAPAVTDSSSGQQNLVGLPSDAVQFSLAPIEDPEFSDIEEGTAAPLQESDALYVEQDGYAYRLDPATLEPVGGPLDPVTHEPISLESETVATPAPEQSSVSAQPELGETSDKDTPTRTEPTQDNRYPNTGVFLEDDVW